MDDYISRQAAVDALQKEINKGIPPFNDVLGSIRCGVRLARNIVEDLPSADVQPVRHGKWIKHILKNANVPWGHDCSNCGEWFVIGNDTAERYKYCPHCGAHMEGVSDEIE